MILGKFWSNVQETVGHSTFQEVASTALFQILGVTLGIKRIRVFLIDLHHDYYQGVFFNTNGLSTGGASFGPWRLELLVAHFFLELEGMPCVGKTGRRYSEVWAGNKGAAFYTFSVGNMV